MIRIITLSIILFFLTSCSSIAPPDQQLREQQIVETTKIFNIVIKSWGKQKYSGLLAIRNSLKGIRYILLDPTGIKLLESEIILEEQHLKGPQLGPLAGSSLNKFLSRAFKRIFLEIPDELPCMRRGLARLCYNIDPEGRWEKTYQIWPLMIWRVEKKSAAKVTKTMYLYFQPWIGMGVELREVSNGK